MSAGVVAAIPGKENPWESCVAERGTLATAAASPWQYVAGILDNYPHELAGKNLSHENLVLIMLDDLLLLKVCVIFVHDSAAALAIFEIYLSHLRVFDRNSGKEKIRNHFQRYVS